MQVFKTFLKIAKKKFPSVLLYYIIFTVIVIAMSKIGASDHETSFTATKADIYIIEMCIRDRAFATRKSEHMLCVDCNKCP